ncbi:MAG TPA: pitrilysin family protein [Reyranella sp.]|nr:pitrilysin family protein [Reyranella sp.]
MSWRRLALAGLLTVGLAPAAGAVDVREVTTPLGLKAWLVQDKSAPVVALSFSFDGGSATEPDAKKGVTNLMAIMLTDGAGSLPAEDFRRRQQDATASIGFGASPDLLSGSLRVLSANRDKGFELLRLAMMEPRFDQAMLDQRRAQSIAGLNQAEQRPGTVAMRTLTAALFENHPYAHAVSGLRDSLKALTPGDLRTRAHELLSRDGLLISAVGDIDAGELGRELDRTFGGLPARTAKPALPDWTPPARPRTIVVQRPVPQSSVLMAMPALNRDDPDWYAALVMTQILGGGQQSRLFDEVREKRGLAYGVSASLRSYAKASVLMISTASANEKVAEAIDVIGKQLERMRSGDVTADELADAKTYLSGSLALSLDSSGAVSNMLQSFQVDRLPRDYFVKRADLIAAVTAADVHRVAGRILREQALTTVVVGQPVGLTSDR